MIIPNIYKPNIYKPNICKADWLYSYKLVDGGGYLQFYARHSGPTPDAVCAFLDAKHGKEGWLRSSLSAAGVSHDDLLVAAIPFHRIPEAGKMPPLHELLAFVVAHCCNPGVCTTAKVSSHIQQRFQLGDRQMQALWPLLDSLNYHALKLHFQTPQARRPGQWQLHSGRSLEELVALWEPQ